MFKKRRPERRGAHGRPKAQATTRRVRRSLLSAAAADFRKRAGPTRTTRAGKNASSNKKRKRGEDPAPARAMPATPVTDYSAACVFAALCAFTMEPCRLCVFTG